MAFSHFVGIVLLLLGGVIFLSMVGIFDLSLYSTLYIYWPVGLILAGIALVARQRLIATLLLVATAAFFSLYQVDDFGAFDHGEMQTYKKILEADASVSKLQFDLSFGAGDVTITSGENLYAHSIETTSSQEPEFTFTVEESTGKIDLSKEGKRLLGKDSWSIELTRNMPMDIDLSYGAADLDVDLRQLQVQTLTISSGASETEILFGNYPTSTQISTGASEVDMIFPPEIGVKVEIDGAAIGSSFPDFDKIGSTYFSKNFDGASSFIDVSVDAGAADISGVIQ